MKKKYVICLLLCACVLVCNGCGKKADENKPISEVKAEAETMDTAKLRKMAEVYKDAIIDKKAEVEKVAAQLKEIPVTKMLGEEAKGLKAEVDQLNKSVSALTERFKVYYDKLKEKGGDTSGLQI
jgi:hypothetical protein